MNVIRSVLILVLIMATKEDPQLGSQDPALVSLSGRGREDLFKLRVSELQGQLEARGLDSTGKKAELVDRLCVALDPVSSLTGVVAPEGADGGDGALGEELRDGRSQGGVTESVQVIVERLRLIREKQMMDEAQSRMRARSEQIDLELKLMEITGRQIDESVLSSVKVTVGRQERADSLTEAVVSQTQRALLPPSELKPFSGDICEFRLFVRAFKARVECRTEDENERLHYLDQYTVGTPNKIVRGCMFLDTGGYTRALATLEERYGSRHRLVHEYTRKMREWPKVQSDDVKGLDRFVLFLKEVDSAVADLGREFDHPQFIRAILGKMPPAIHDRILRRCDTFMELGGKTARLSDHGSNHPTLLHRSPNDVQDACMVAPPARPVAAPPSGQAQPAGGSRSSVVTANARVVTREGRARVFMPIVAVKVRGSGGRTVLCNAFLDGGSSGCFATEELAGKLRLQPEQTTISVDTVCGEGQVISSSVLEGLEVSAIEGRDWRSLPVVFTLPRLPVSGQDMFLEGDLPDWPHLNDIFLPQVSTSVDLLIGINAPHLHVAEEVRVPESGSGPHAVRSPLGWYVIGAEFHERIRRSHSVNFIRTSRKAQSDDTGNLFEQLYEQDFSGLDDDSVGLSVEDRLWLDRVRATVRKDEEGHFEIGLPRSTVTSVPDSRPVAEKRLMSLRRKLMGDPSLFQSYRAVMQSLVTDGYAVRVPQSELTVPSGDVWYLPHHAVVTPSKVRVVFDCAARAGGVCLNDILQGGPHLGQPLNAVIARFREGRIAFTCDIEAMYHRVHVPAGDCDLFRFLWFKDDDLSGDVEVWRMRSHVFGAVTSSSVACLAVQLCAEEGKGQFPAAADALQRRTYVDDTLVAVESVEDAVSLARDLTELCQTGAFHLKKFASNSAEFLQHIPEDERGKSVKDLNLAEGALGSNRVLGVEWDMGEDVFRFHFQDKETPVTRRGILSAVSAIFDPLGFWAPVTLSAKMLVQKLCAASLGWDEAIPPALAGEWESWIRQAKGLDGMQLPRAVCGPKGKVISTELHIFVDASESAYSAVAYVRKEVMTGPSEVEVYIGFLMGKCRLAPLRFVTIPRLELAGGVLGCQLRQFLVRELDTKFDRIRMWSDSMVVLSCICNRKTRFKTYVANRLSYIHGATNVSDWSYVPSRDNPADVGSRGAEPHGLQVWLQGPLFLRQDESGWPEEPAVQSDLPVAELKKPVPVAAVVIGAADSNSTDVLIGHYSSLFRLKKAVAWFRKFFDCVRSGAFRQAVVARRRGLRPRSVGIDSRLTVFDLDAAEVAIFRFVQTSSFPELYHDGKGMVTVPKGSPLSRLNVVARGNGLLAVGGRLSRCPVSHDFKHPVLLPRDHHVSQLVIRQAHEKVGHQGREHTLWKVRERFWILGGGSAVRSLLRSCVTCRKSNSAPQVQMMADLPEDRVTPETPAFSSIGLDVFGPIIVKRGRLEVKRYGLICTCLVSRAIHLEVLHSLRTDSLINALRRVVARRGPIKRVRSDMGTNMVGADNDLKAEISRLDRRKLQQVGLAEGIEWVFNPPSASHFGGCWERHIRTVRKVWRSMPVQRLDDESLHTLFCEIESVLNSRPLTYVSTSQGDVEPLTPNHLLLLRGCGEGVVGQFTADDLLSVKRWKQVQYLAEQFWLRWRRDYLPTLQRRQRWVHRSRNVEPGDVVLIADEEVPRGHWALGRVLETYPSRDGLVRKVRLRTGGTVLTRPVHKLIVLLSDSALP
ncbi:uncharacterized protein LOC122372549 [Amphibalanus amphitrite]|uniref:uncharacterized protein LOC122372549 n=1 Tax=Amphibalanus amphitrite TaxID=1232801 RepID=UPI001C92614B|nr:uncharacterized protein LOC122372549 [Amphibalanus amphitrite]